MWNALPLEPDMNDNFTAREEQALRAALARGETVRCPRCGIPLVQTPIPPRREVAYVRDRVLFQCVSCRLKGVVDRG